MKFLLILAILPVLFGFKFNPMSQSIEISERKTAQFTVENDTDQPMAIELSVKERVMNEKGVEELPATVEMSIFPPQMIIPPKEKRSVRVNWNGTSALKTEKSFRVIAEQLPLNVEKGAKKKAGIQMLMRYIAALYVTPESGSSKISGTIQSTTANALSLAISNEGHIHQILAKPEITFKKDEKKWVLKDEELKGLSGENVLALGRRVFDLKTTQKIPQDATVSIKLNE